MKRIPKLLCGLPNLPRRRFIQGLAAGGVLLGVSPWLRPAWAQVTDTTTGSAPVLSGTEFDLTIAETPVNFTGRPRLATTINGSIPAPTLRWRQGDTITLRVTNRLPVDTSIHWHGILLPFQMDGVPGISFKGIAPGETFIYRFKVQQTGTYWYHSHSGMQEQTGMYGAIVIEPARGGPIRADRDYIVQLSDWTDEDPMRVLAKLKMQSDYYNFNQPTVVDFFRDAANDGVSAAMAKRRMWQQMRMNPTDLADVSAYTYTYLMNGTTPAGNWTGLFRPGEKIRLRFINSGAMTFFDVRIPGLKMTVIQADGQDVEPFTVDEIRIGVAETYDVIVAPKDDAYTIFAQSMDRTGHTRGTLAVRAGMTADVPAVDKPEPLSMGDMMGDMGGGMGGMDHSAHGGMAMDHSQHAMGAMTMGGGQVRARHARTEYGPGVDMRVDMPRTNLDDPGIGLRNNGRRVLTYADLHTIGGPLDRRGPEREIELHLTGNMERYTWSFDGLEFGKSTPVHFRHNERLRVILVNDTMMTHPMHLHGMWSELENPDGRFQIRKHVINVQPAQRVSFLVTADALGRWAWHCHLLLHMDAGMFREVVVA
ncbi:copper resistance protein CopA [Sulfuricaulis limicola]|uniref:Copper resistance protein CopA n=1 Tax=Sulfuricaulis limicola TaxID=1620215 RepID=A0A1B4XEQ6_9GAMM|nr:copper resistance system multicopper oxidase [Sulfuricaulis limicola]BAV33276.1 copper resistance protein CopA [Sulfuricaulis limicola]